MDQLEEQCWGTFRKAFYQMEFQLFVKVLPSLKDQQTFW